MNYCRNCAYLDVQPRADGKIVPHHSRVYPCTAPVPAMPVLPRSITMRLNFQWPPAKILMWANAGWDCQMHKKRAKAPGGQA